MRNSPWELRYLIYADTDLAGVLKENGVISA
jgi:hypothetical protein